MEHVVNFNDDVPHLPPRPLGYQQSSNEVWIEANGVTYEFCDGQENPVRQLGVEERRGQSLSAELLGQLGIADKGDSALRKLRKRL